MNAIEVPSFITDQREPTAERVMPSDRHVCPWPGCDFWTPNRFWGCPPHWELVPMDLKREWLRALGNDGLKLKLATDAVTNWVEANHATAKRPLPRVVETPPPAPAAAPVAPPVAAPAPLAPAAPILTATFASGLTADGEVFLFWPRSGEYLTLSPAEAALVGKIARMVEGA